MKTSSFLPGSLILIVVAAVADWLSAGTTRLYSERSTSESAQPAGVRQEFRIHRRTVRPEIVGNGEARFRFPIDTRVPSKLVFAVELAPAASYEVFVHTGGTRQRIAASGGGERRTSYSISLPKRAGELEFVQHGSIRWVDLRLVRTVFLWPIYVLGVGVIFALAARQLRWRRFVRPEWVMLFASTLLGLTTAEFALRRFSKKLPAVTAARSDLGAVGADSRLIDPVRYKMRLRPNLNTYYEWRYGAIVRLGFISKEVSRGPLYRYALRTDAEGFRNEKVRTKIDIAALGDSFTDGASGPAEESWPAYLEKLSGLVVQNYGTSGFGPQQELYALRDFALVHHPQWVIVAFYAGNDLRDAEVFDRWERNGARESDEREGWELARTYRRYETLYLWTVVRMGTGSLWRLVTVSSDRSPMVAEAAVPERPTFNRGMFNVPVANHDIQFAFLSPYLRQLGMPRPEIEAGRGWQLTEQALRDVKQECETSGAGLLLVFVPGKEQVYWPLAERSFSAAELQAAVDFYCPPGEATLTIEAIHTRRLALNEVVQDFCARERVPMLDLTARLEREVEAGRGTYFPDDTHWNATGHEVAAREIAEFLARKP